MYFASDRCNTQAVCTALAGIIRHRPGLNWLALVDGAFDFGEVGMPLPNDRHMLYACSGMTDLLAASPFLVMLSAGDENVLQSELAALLRHRKERPMLSFIATAAEVGAVLENFRFFANTRTEDGQEMIVRFADTRVLPGLFDGLRPVNWNGMTCLLEHWSVINRKGELQELSLREGRAPLAGAFQLSAAEFVSLLSHGEPDAIIDAIADSNPEILQEDDRAAFYERVAHACRFAKSHRVHAFPDLVALAYLAILNEGKGLNNPKLGEMVLRQQWKSGSLIDELLDFVE